MNSYLPPMPENIEAALKALQYDRSWLDSGMISVENLLRQYADFGKTNYASSPEHLRLCAFEAWRAYRVLFTDAEVAAFAHAIRIDPDPNMASSVLISMMMGGDLSPPQFDVLLRLGRDRDLGDKKLAWIEYRREGIEAEKNESRSLERARRGVPEIEKDLAHSSSHLRALEYLSSSGGSKETRSVAAQRLRRFTWRGSS